MKKLFTISFINTGIQNLHLQYMDENIPTPLEQSCLGDGSFRQNGNYMYISFNYKCFDSFSNVGVG